MRAFLNGLSAVVSAGLLIWMTTTASTVSPVAAQAGTPVEGREIRVTIFNGEAAEYHVWRLSPGGQATGISNATYNRGRSHYFEEIVDRGSWKLTGDTLCVTWTKLLNGGTHCYRVTTAGKQFTGTAVSSGRTIRGTIAPLK